MKNINNLHIWIKKQFIKYSQIIEKLAIYGSIAKNEDFPNDCDLLIVVNIDFNQDDWILIREDIEIIKEKFYRTFFLPLNVSLLTENEWKELQSFFNELFEIFL